MREWMQEEGREIFRQPQEGARPAPRCEGNDHP